MADISGIGGGINNNIPQLNRRREDIRNEEETTLERVRNEAQELQRSGISAPTQSNLSAGTVETIQRSRPAVETDPRERAIEERDPSQRGFRPEDTEDSVSLSQRARTLLAERQAAENEQTQAADQRTVSDVRENFSTRNEERVDLNERLAEENTVSAFSRIDNLERVEDSVLNNDEAERNDISRDIAQQRETQQTEREQANNNVNAEQVIAINSYQQTQNLTEANDNIEQSTQVANNAQDTTNISGNLDQTNVPVGQRVLGQIIDQFA